MPGQTYNIKIVLSTNARDTGRDLGDVGDQGRRAAGGIDDASEAAGKSGRQFASLGGLVKEAAANFAGYLSAQAVFAGLQKAAAFAYDTVLNFDQQMTESLAIMGDQAAGTREAMEQTARTVAVDYNAAVSDVAQAYYFLASAGYDAATSQKAVGQVTAFAKAGMFDLETATELAADAQNAMGLKSADSSENLKQLTRITDVLTQANIVANGSVEDFAKALTNKAAASARLAGVSLESTTAVLAAFAAQGLKGLKAGEAFSIVLRDLQEKARTNSDAFKALGITVFDAQGGFAGFPKIVGQIEKALSGMSVQQANATIATLGFTAEGGAYIKTLIGMSQEIANYEEKMKSAGGVTQQIAEKQMQSMIEQLKHLKALAAEAALQGFDKLAEAGAWLAQQFGPALGNIAEAAKDLAKYLLPIGQALALITGGAIVGGLKAIAVTLQLVTQLLRDNQGVVNALATVGLVMLAANLAKAGAAFLSAAADQAAFFAFNAAGKIDAVVDALVNMRNGFAIAREVGATFTQSMRAAVSAMLGTAGAAIAVTAGLAAIGLAIYGVIRWYQDGKESAAKFNEEVKKKHDTSSLQGLRDAIRETQQEVDRLGKQGSTIGERFNLPAMVAAESKMNDLKDTVGDLTTKLHAQDSAYWDLAKAMQAQQEPALRTREGLIQLHDQIDKIATKEKIDPVSPDGAKKLADMAMAATAASPAVQQLRQAFAVAGDAATSAEDAVKAYEQALQALFGVHIAAKEAEISFATALDDVHGKLAAGMNLLDVYNAKNREGASAVLSAADAALQHAVSVYTETGSLDAATAVLGQHREQLIASMTATGMSRIAAEQYINTLNLTPENILTLAKLNKEQADAGLAALNQNLAATTTPRTVSVYADVSRAVASLNTLEQKLGYVSRLANSGDLGRAGAALGATLAGRADGGVYLEQYASGGMRENHVAQIAPPGTWRLWAEPETGGEAYIPLAPAKRKDSVAIMQAVAKMFGYGMYKFAAGGYMGDDRVQGWSESMARAYAVGAGGLGPAASSSSFTMAPGAVQITVGQGSDPLAVQRAVERALAGFAKDMRRELKTRRTGHRFV